MNIYQSHMTDCLKNVSRAKVRAQGAAFREINGGINLNIDAISAAFAEDRDSVELLLSNGHQLELQFLSEDGFKFFLENLNKYWNSK